ncbi:YihY/virulence factor BrkB family protein [Allopontixanthobacter sediminis]|uniref:YihY family inner membrane protein n=1 Tax=Allopontixanthobacter sediminis TaxID=1689985 RepID=A0A845AXB5_9SPHN|nr:YihY/virulence factor BrkB family protein [Allopontixanthobacter sediminis]MXP42895.1 YihY family inner membrane protein [Allopontixanthobacter sediminis]
MSPESSASAGAFPLNGELAISGNEERSSVSSPDAATSFQNAGARWWRIAKATWAEASKDNLSLIASGVAFYAFTSFVPTLAAVVLSYGLFAEPEQVARHISALAAIMPDEAAEIIGRQLSGMVEIASSAVGIGLFLSLGLALYGTMKGAGAMVTALNIVFEVRESRSFVWSTLVSIAVAGGMIGIFLLASIAISAITLLQGILPDMGGTVRTAVQIGFWIIAAMAVRVAISTLYRFAPSRPPCPESWLKPGSAFATVGWIAATAGFAFYVRDFGSYNATYGALGAVVIFLTWLYLSAYIILLGAELNRILERGDA